MRFTAFLLSLALVPSTLSQTLNHPRDFDLASRDADHTRTCVGLYTRDQTTCQCLPGFDNPGKPRQDCRCPDEKNTRLVITQHIPKCQCTGGAQKYNTGTERCECKPGYVGSYNHQGVLSCRLPPTKTHHHTSTSTSSTGPSATYGYPTQYKRAIKNAISQRESDVRSVEHVLGCRANEKACEAEGAWKCIDVQSRLATCGGCPGEALDCEAIPGVDEVHCNLGHCVIDSCRRGFTLKSTGSATNTTDNAICVSKQYTSPWLKVQN